MGQTRNHSSKLAGDNMRRLVLILLFAISCLQLAVAGARGVDAGAPATPGVLAVSDADSRRGVSGPCGSHGVNADADTRQSQPCDLTQACEACTLCQACHQPAMASAALAATFKTEDRPPPALSVTYVSAERAPGFKPPIL